MVHVLLSPQAWLTLTTTLDGILAPACPPAAHPRRVEEGCKCSTPAIIVGSAGFTARRVLADHTATLSTAVVRPVLQAGTVQATSVSLGAPRLFEYALLAPCPLLLATCGTGDHGRAGGPIPGTELQAVVCLLQMQRVTEQRDVQ